MVRRGDVRWTFQPDEKPRPVCVLTRDEAIPVLARLVVAPATTTRRGIDTEVPLSLEDGMPRECVLSLDNTFTIARSLLGDRITGLSAVRMHEVCRALAVATGC